MLREWLTIVVITLRRRALRMGSLSQVLGKVGVNPTAKVSPDQHSTLESRSFPTKKQTSKPRKRNNRVKRSEDFNDEQPPSHHLCLNRSHIVQLSYWLPHLEMPLTAGV